MKLSRYQKYFIFTLIGTAVISGVYFGADQLLNNKSINAEDSNVVQDIQNSNVIQGSEESQILDFRENQGELSVEINNYYFETGVDKEEYEKRINDLEEQIALKNDELEKVQLKLVKSSLELIPFYHAEKNFERTIFYSLEVLNYQLKNTDALSYLGYGLGQLESFQESIDAYDKLLAIKPDDYHALINNAWSYTQLTHYDDALRELKKVENKYPEDLVMLSNKCWVLEKTKNYEDAVPICKRVLVENEEDERALKAYSLSLSMLHRSDEALPYHEKVYQLFSNEIITLINYGNALADVGKYDDAVIIYDEGLEREPNNQALIYNKDLICKTQNVACNVL